MDFVWRRSVRIRSRPKRSSPNQPPPKPNLCRAGPPTLLVFTDPIPAPIAPMVLLIGNYLLDRQHSMQRFGMMMLSGLVKAGVAAELLVPSPFLGTFRNGRGFIAKWLAYIDKYILFRWRLKRELARHPSVVHICDHSNAVYVDQISNVPVLVTCHDLLAVRDALGEETHCPMSFTGKILQRWILRALRRVT